MGLRGVRSTVLLIVVVGAAVLLLRLLLPKFADFITYIYVAFVFVVVLYRLGREVYSGSHARRPLVVTSAVRDRRYQRLLTT